MRVVLSLVCDWGVSDKSYLSGILFFWIINLYGLKCWKNRFYRFSLSLFFMCSSF